MRVRVRVKRRGDCLVYGVEQHGDVRGRVDTWCAMCWVGAVAEMET